MRIGVIVGPERGRYRTKVDRLRADARWADESGFASVWVPQIPDDFDALTAAAIVGAETTRIEVGTAVVPVQPRHPIALAQQALSVQAVCEGRFPQLETTPPGTRLTVTVRSRSVSGALDME